MSAYEDADAMFAAAERVRPRLSHWNAVGVGNAMVTWPVERHAARDLDIASEYGFDLHGGPGWVRFEDPNSDFFRWESR